MADPLTIVFMPESAYGPTNNCIGIGKILEQRGHRVVFAAEASWAGRLEPLGFEEDLVDGQCVQREHRSPNGIIPSLLSFFADGRVGSWVAWSTAAAAADAERLRTPVDPCRYPGLTAARVPLSQEEVDTFYKRFSKEAFWPVINGRVRRTRFGTTANREFVSQL